MGDLHEMETQKYVFLFFWTVKLYIKSVNYESALRNMIRRRLL